MNLDLTDLQTDVLIRELFQIVQNDRYPLSPRIVAPEGDPGAAAAGARARATAPRDGITSRRARGRYRQRR